MKDFILLRTGKPAQRHQLVICQDGSLRRTHNHHNQVYPSQPAQHLYQLSKEWIKKGDFYLMKFGKGDYELVESYSQEDADRATSHPTIAPNCFKIVQSTDSSLNLPPIPEETIQAFIQRYNPK